jgi:hypothetical protein
MNIYAIEILLQGTVHIKATSKEQAERILAHNCSNTIHGRDKWLLKVLPCQRPRASLSTTFASAGSVGGANFVGVSKRTVYAAQDRWPRNWDGLRWAYEPLSTEYELVPVYSAELDVTTTAFIRANDVDEAEAVLAKFNQSSLDLSTDRSRWFSRMALDDEGRSDLPIALSSALYLVGKSKGSELSQTWPDGPYLGPEFITWVDEFL